MLANSSRWSLKDSLLGQPNKSSGNSVLLVKVKVTLLWGGHRGKGSPGHRWTLRLLLRILLAVRCLTVWNSTVRGIPRRQWSFARYFFLFWEEPTDRGREKKRKKTHFCLRSSVLAEGRSGGYSVWLWDLLKSEKYMLKTDCLTYPTKFV